MIFGSGVGWGNDYVLKVISECFQFKTGGLTGFFKPLPYEKGPPDHVI
jgi:hypothetical protein